MKTPSRRSFLVSALLLISGILGFQLGQHQSSGDSLPSSQVRSQGGPLIGIASLTNENYIRAVRQAGGIPVVLPNTDGSAAEIRFYLERLDGLLLPGGADIPPSEYDEEAHSTVEVLDDSRFKFEKALSRAWIHESAKPMLGVCLGSQWINVSSGGSLVQDIPSEYGVNHRDVRHEVTLEKDSRLSSILGRTSLTVNSFHHQAVKKLGQGLRIVARSSDGVIEATESTDPDRFLIGVQWHPEKPGPDDEVQSRLLKAFVAAARNARSD